MTTTSGSRNRSGYGRWLVLAAAASAAGCVTVNGYEAETVDGRGNVVSTDSAGQSVRVTARELSYFASPYLGVVSLSFENTTSDFIQIDSVSLAFGGELDKHVSIPVGAHISEWRRAVMDTTSGSYGWPRERGVTRMDRDVLSDIDRFDQSRSFSGAQAGSEVPLIAPNIRTLVSSADMKEPPRLPAGHVLAGSFALPPMLTTSRWLLIESDARVGTCLERMFVTLDIAHRAPLRLLVQFRDKALSTSPWQSQECAPPPQPSATFGAHV